METTLAGVEADDKLSSQSPERKLIPRKERNAGPVCCSGRYGLLPHSLQHLVRLEACLFPTGLSATAAFISQSYRKVTLLWQSD